MPDTKKQSVTTFGRRAATTKKAPVPKPKTREERRRIWAEELSDAASRAVARGGVNAPEDAQLVIQSMLPLMRFLVR